MSSLPTTTPAVSGSKRIPERLCVGCGEHDAIGNLVRVVKGPGGLVAVDVAGKSFGRGAHVHARRLCLAAAVKKGFAKAFKCRVVLEDGGIEQMVSAAVERRLRGLLLSAARSGNLTLGLTAVTGAYERGEVELLWVAADAGHAAKQAVVQKAQADGRLVTWGLRDALGAVLGRPEVAILGVREPLIARAIVETRSLDGD